MGFADLHIHSIYSFDGTSTISAILKYAADKTNLNVIAITDHDTMAGVREAQELAPDYGIEIIPGCEVSTADGHLLALFIDQPIRAGLSLIHTALEVAAQGGLCIAAHPQAAGVHALRIETIRKALVYPGVFRSLVGIETYNGGLVYTRSNPQAAAAAAALPLAHTGNSDAHVLPMIAQGATEFPGYTAADLRRALVERKTTIHRGTGLTGVEVLRSYIPRLLLRRLGWVAWNAHPAVPTSYARLSKIQSVSVSSVR